MRAGAEGAVAWHNKPRPNTKPRTRSVARTLGGLPGMLGATLSMRRGQATPILRASAVHRERDDGDEKGEGGEGRAGPGAAAEGEEPARRGV